LAGIYGVWHADTVPRIQAERVYKEANIFFAGGCFDWKQAKCRKGRHGAY
jgi:hypothetical protein